MSVYTSISIKYMNFLILTQNVFTADVNYPRPEPFMSCNVLFIH